MENWLTAHPNEIKGVIGENDEMALGAIQEIKGRGLNVKDFVVVGIDGVPDAINAVKAGEMFSILQDAEGQAAAPWMSLCGPRSANPISRGPPCGNSGKRKCRGMAEPRRHILFPGRLLPQRTPTIC